MKDYRLNIEPLLYNNLTVGDNMRGAGLNVRENMPHYRNIVPNKYTPGLSGDQGYL